MSWFDTASGLFTRRAGRGGGIGTFLGHRAGVAGAAILVVAALVAVIAPLLIPADALDVTRVTAAAWQSPGAQYWLGTDHTGQSVALLVVQATLTSTLTNGSWPPPTWDSSPRTSTHACRGTPAGIPSTTCRE